MARTLQQLSKVGRRMEETRSRRDELIAQATKEGSSRREVAKAARLTPGRIQQIVKALGLSLLALLLVASSASASTELRGGITTQSTYQGPFTQDLSIAASFWGVGPNCAPQRIAIVFSDLPGDAVTGEDTAAAAWPGGCRSRLHNFWERVSPGEWIHHRDTRLIWVDADYFDHGGASAEWWCTAIVHEYGHLLGLQHSSDPTSVMHSPLVVGSVPGCAGVH